MKKNYFVAASLLVGMLSFAQLGNSLNFDGTNDYVNCGNPTSLQLTGNTMTLEAYVRPETLSTTGINTIFGKETGTASYILRIKPTGVVNFYIGSTSGGKNLETSANALTVSPLAWQHVAATYDGATMKIYIDGILKASSAQVFSFNVNIGNLEIGGVTSFGGRYFDGTIDEVRIWNIARTATQIADNKTSELAAGDRSGLVAYYQFNQGTAGGDNASQTTLIDSSTNANNGTLTNFNFSGSTSNFVDNVVLPAESFAIDSKTQIFPNPATNEVTINHNDLTNVAVKVTDIAGKVLINESLNEASNTLNIANLNAGIYLFTISSNEGQTTKKIVKK